MKRPCPSWKSKAPPLAVPRPLDQGNYAESVLPLLQERVKTFEELTEISAGFLLQQTRFPMILRPHPQEDGPRCHPLRPECRNDQPSDLASRWDPESLEALLRPLAPDLGIKTGQLFGALRVAVTGRTAAPPLFDTMSVLGKERCMKRIQDALNLLTSSADSAS